MDARNDAYVVIAEFWIDAERRDEFAVGCLAHSRLAVRDEPGCLQYDVHVDPADARHVVLYEVYADRAAFEAHQLASHFLRWREGAQPLIRERKPTHLHRRR